MKLKSICVYKNHWSKLRIKDLFNLYWLERNCNINNKMEGPGFVSIRILRCFSLPFFKIIEYLAFKFETDRPYLNLKNLEYMRKQLKWIKFVDACI